MPAVRVVKWGVGGEGSMFSPQLAKRIEERLARDEQVILLLNRRAFSTCIRCPDCGATARCPNCDITLRYHRVGLKLECHYCGHVEKAFDLCPECRGHRLSYSGVGTQRVEKELERLFPEAKLSRMDLDTTRSQGAHQDILTRFARREFNILLGTKMVAKGHDFPGVTLVGVLGADFEWLRPDFRAIEKAFRLLVQASGRTGRTGPGEVLIQSWEPTHPMLRWVQQHDYKQLYLSEIKSRAGLSYPPFGRLIALWVIGPRLETVVEAAAVMRELLSEVLETATVLGPAPPPVERVENLYRRKLLVKLPARFDTKVRADKSAVGQVVDRLRGRFQRSRLRFVVDVDPVEA